MSAARPWRGIEGGVELAVRLTPRGGRAGVEGVIEAEGKPCLKLRVASPPVDGAANAALIAYLAKALDLPRSAVTLISGERARVKRLRLIGAGVAARLEGLVAGKEE